MSANPNRVTNFWQELKRRKVIKVLAMYAGAAYVLIELSNNVLDSEVGDTFSGDRVPDNSNSFMDI